MPLPNLKKTTTPGQCEAMRCTELGDNIPGDLWGRDNVRLCARHAAKALAVALDYAEKSPEHVADTGGEPPTQLALRFGEASVSVAPASSAAYKRAGVGAQHIGMRNVDGVLNWLQAVKSAVEGIQANTEEAASVLALAEQFEIVTHADMVSVAEWTQEAAKSLKQLESTEKEITSPISTAVSRIRSIFRPTKQLWVDAQTILRAQLAAARLREDERNRKIMEDAASAHAVGDDRADLSGLTVSTDLDGVSMKVLWKAVVDDVMLLPLEYVIRVPDVKKLKEYCAAAEAAGTEPEPIQGVRFERDVAMRVQSRG
jgi:hypothetical protein